MSEIKVLRKLTDGTVKVEMPDGTRKRVKLSDLDALLATTPEKIVEVESDFVEADTDVSYPGEAYEDYDEDLNN